VAVDPLGDVIYVVSDQDSHSSDEFLAFELPVDYFDLDDDDEFSDSDIDVLFLAIALNDDDYDYDYDVDGDLDVDADDAEFYIKDFLYTYYGDCNLDREFNSSDLVLTQAAGEYEDNEEDNSTWIEGDWTGDFDFTSSDLVAASADGGFEQGPRL
jgi:hypothetical protein